MASLILGLLKFGFTTLITFLLPFVVLELNCRYYSWLDKQTVLDDLQEEVARFVGPAVIVIFFMYVILFQLTPDS